MAEHANITRRAALVGALFSSAALAVPAIAAVKDTAPSFPHETLEAIARWNRAKDARSLAWRDYEATWKVERDGKFVALPPAQVDLVAERRTHAAMMSASDEAQAAERAMLNLLRKTEIDVPAIYRG